MVEYNLVKFCRFCKARFVVPKAKGMQYLCKECDKSQNKPAKASKPVAKKKPTKK